MGRQGDGPAAIVADQGITHEVSKPRGPVQTGGTEPVTPLVTTENVARS